MNGYRTIFRATLVQDTALCSSGAGEAGETVDAAFARDGQGALVLRGETLAGALIATAGKLGLGSLDMVTSGISPNETIPSRWQVNSARPSGNVETQIRRSVGIRHDTGARAGGVLYDAEVTPRGTTWEILFEVDTTGADGLLAEQAAAAALKDWERGRCWIGAAVARGLGWAHVTNLKAIRLGLDKLRLWPSSFEEPLAAADALDTEPVASDDFKDVFDLAGINGDWRYIEISGRINAGEAEPAENEASYGLDAIAVGGQELSGFSRVRPDQFLVPRDVKPESYDDNFIPDAGFSMVLSSDGEPEPFLPGSSLRGPLRHTLSRQLRATSANPGIRDPNVDRPRQNVADPMDNAEEIFGDVLRSAALLVSDAHLEEGSQWQGALLQHHAGDEFAGGVYGSGKFDRSVVINGTFLFRAVIEIRPEDGAADDGASLVLKLVGTFGANRHLPIGAAKWRGAGWPEWRIEQVLAGAAGQDAKPRENAT